MRCKASISEELAYSTAAKDIIFPGTLDEIVNRSIKMAKMV